MVPAIGPALWVPPAGGVRPSSVCVVWPGRLWVGVEGQRRDPVVDRGVVSKWKRGRRVANQDRRRLDYLVPRPKRLASRSRESVMSEVPPPDWAALYQKHRDAMYRVAVQGRRTSASRGWAGGRGPGRGGGGYGVFDQVAAAGRAELGGRPGDGSSQLSSELRAVTQTARFKRLVTRWARLRNTSADLATSALTARLATSVHRGKQPGADQMLNSLEALVDALEEDGPDANNG